MQGSKHLALRCFLYRWKGLEAKMSKMTLHGPFGHLQHKLCVKEGPGVKLAIWLPTTKSRESTRPRCVQAECNTPLQVCFRPHPNPRFEQGVMSCQSPGSPNRDSFGIVSGLPLGGPGTKKSFECGPCGVAHSILYGGRWWLPPTSGRGESSESSESRIARGLS